MGILSPSSCSAESGSTLELLDTPRRQSMAIDLAQSLRCALRLSELGLLEAEIIAIESDSSLAEVFAAQRPCTTFSASAENIFRIFSALSISNHIIGAGLHIFPLPDRIMLLQPELTRRAFTPLLTEELSEQLGCTLTELHNSAEYKSGLEMLFNFDYALFESHLYNSLTANFPSQAPLAEWPSQANLKRATGIDTIVILSGRNGDFLARCVDSFGHAALVFNRELPKILVIDDSPAEESFAKRRRAEELAQHWKVDVQFFGPDERQKLLQQISERCDTSMPFAEVEDLFFRRKSFGTARAFAHLLTQGEICMTVDDDAASSFTLDEGFSSARYHLYYLQNFRSVAAKLIGRAKDISADDALSLARSTLWEVPGVLAIAREPQAKTLHASAVLPLYLNRLVSKCDRESVCRSFADMATSLIRDTGERAMIGGTALGDVRRTQAAGLGRLPEIPMRRFPVDVIGAHGRLISAQGTSLQGMVPSGDIFDDYSGKFQGTLNISDETAIKIVTSVPNFAPPGSAQRIIDGFFLGQEMEDLANVEQADVPMFVAKSLAHITRRGIVNTTTCTTLDNRGELKFLPLSTPGTDSHFVAVMMQQQELFGLGFHLAIVSDHRPVLTDRIQRLRSMEEIAPIFMEEELGREVAKAVHMYGAKGIVAADVVRAITVNFSARITQRLFYAYQALETGPPAKVAAAQEFLECACRAIPGLYLPDLSEFRRSVAVAGDTELTQQLDFMPPSLWQEVLNLRGNCRAFKSRVHRSIRRWLTGFKYASRVAAITRGILEEARSDFS